MGIISLVDKDSDGRINAYELIEVIESMDSDIASDKYTEPIEILINYIDSMDVDVAAMFRNLDKNRDGKINREELSNALNENSNEEVDEEAITKLVNMFDVDGNDSIDLFEFIETLEAQDDVVPDERLYPRQKNFLKYAETHDVKTLEGYSVAAYSCWFCILRYTVGSKRYTCPICRW